MAIDIRHAELVCQYGGGSRMCRYLAVAGADYECLKHTQHKDLIDEKCQKGIFITLGDNCEGVLYDTHMFDSDGEGEQTCRNTM